MKEIEMTQIEQRADIRPMFTLDEAKAAAVGLDRAIEEIRRTGNDADLRPAMTTARLALLDAIREAEGR
jgi:hypothetical protein